MTNTCDQVREDLTAYVDDELGADRAAYVGRHCAECTVCGDELRRLERIRELVVSADPALAAPTVDLEPHVLRRIRAESGVRNALPLLVRWRFATVAAAVCAALVVGVFIGMGLENAGQPRQPGTPPVMVTGDMTDPWEWLVSTAANGDVDVIIGVLAPAETGDSELVDEALWYGSSVDELVERLTVPESEDLREELYAYAIQG